jgi:HEAT repeat protein
MDYYFSTFLDHHLNGLLKVHIANLLADLYPNLTSDVQTTVLETLTASFTPSTHVNSSAGYIEYAFRRIGKPSVPFLLGMLSNQSKFVRCQARDALYWIIDGSIRKEGSLPELPCEDISAGKSGAASVWIGWWQSNQAHVEVKEFPSLFDMAYRPLQPPHRDSPR